jgi:hypothetical protein
VTHDQHNPPGGFDSAGLPAVEGNPALNAAGMTRFSEGWDRPTEVPLSCSRKGDKGECPGHIPNVLQPSVCIYCDEAITPDGQLLQTVSSDLVGRVAA